MKRRRAGPIPLYVVAGSAAATAVVSAVVHIAVSIIVLAAADPDQDDHDNDPPPVVFAPKRIRRTHKLFPPIKDFTSYYGGSSALVTRRQKFFPAVRPETAPAPLRLPAYSCKSLPLYIDRKAILSMRHPASAHTVFRQDLQRFPHKPSKVFLCERSRSLFSTRGSFRLHRFRQLPVHSGGARLSRIENGNTCTAENAHFPKTQAFVRTPLRSPWENQRSGR